MRQRCDFPKLTYGDVTIAEAMAKPGRIERFRAKVASAGGERECWTWLGGTNKAGYGLHQGSDDYRGWSFTAHRIAYWLHTGVEPTKIVLHTCDNPRCCNPNHLRHGTHQDNTADMVSKGRAAWQNGVPVGPKGPHKPEQVIEARRLRYEERWQIRDIAEHLGRQRSTVSRWLRS